MAWGTKVLAALLLVLVIVNAFVTGWLTSRVRGLEASIAAVATVQRDATQIEDVRNASLPVGGDD